MVRHASSSWSRSGRAVDDGARIDRGNSTSRKLGAGGKIIQIRKLRYLVQVARAGSLSRASTGLNVAQSALSRQLMKLEDELGVALLVRHGRGVRLTRAGTTLLEHAHAVLLQIDQPFRAWQPRQSNPTQCYDCNPNSVDRDPGVTDPASESLL
jgi:DNA-binding transcriptional ArsR family regulator